MEMDGDPVEVDGDPQHPTQNSKARLGYACTLRPSDNRPCCGEQTVPLVSDVQGHLSQLSECIGNRFSMITEAFPPLSPKSEVLPRISVLKTGCLTKWDRH
jgi:hypothetical protein